MSKPKYPFEKRLEVVNHYFTTDDGYRIISARFGVPRTQVRTWVALYEKHGEKGLIPKPKGVSADPELRIKVVKAVTEQQMSLNQWIGPYISIHFLSLNPLLVRRRRYSRGERYPSALCGCHSL
ncbi:hypothetical protein NUKP18_54160 [Klebsiella variicola]|nr:hypothetical protein NUKP18_54160 [Klebsiella variicola]GKM94058.1 hypothetical protein NUBL21999_42530 [Klebsiella pneumoniae]